MLQVQTKLERIQQLINIIIKPIPSKEQTIEVLVFQGCNLFSSSKRKFLAAVNLK